MTYPFSARSLAGFQRRQRKSRKRRRLAEPCALAEQHAAGRDDSFIDAPIVLESELVEHSEHSQLIHQIRRIEHVHAIRVIRITLDDEMRLERLRVLDQPIELID